MRLTLALCLLLIGHPVIADDRLLQRSCAVCHGSLDRPTAMPAFFHRSPAWIEQRLREFRARSRKGSVMPAIAGGLDDQQIESLAKHFGQARP